MAKSTCSLVNLDTLERIPFQFVPPSLSYSPEIHTQAISAVSRNTPLYQNVGSEDVISFDLHWVAMEENRKDVITKCRMIESWAKNDGFNKRPARVMLVWGNLFKSNVSGEFLDYDGKFLIYNDVFLITKCPYELQLWNAQAGMYPTMAIQHIELKRLSEKSRTREEISDVY